MDASVLRQIRTLAGAVHGSRARVQACLYVAGVGSSWAPPEHLRPKLADLRRTLAELDADDRHYAASTLYAVSMGKKSRKTLAAYFTPPFVVRCAIDSAVRAGLDLRAHSVMDPAAGGAAFLSSVAARMKAAGCSPDDIGHRLHGIEIDPGLASVATALVSTRAGIPRSKVRITVRDSLALLDEPHQLYDAVLANPPYGRATGRLAKTAARFSEFVSPGHVNRYALFSGLATRMVRPGGVVALVIPASFLTGPLFAPLRKHFRSTCNVQEIVMLASRDGAFLDVTQDACVLTLTRASGEITDGRTVAPFAVLADTGELESRGLVDLPSDPGAPWRLPGKVSDSPGTPFTLEDYGVEAKSGYFVWNRELARMTTRQTRYAVPLIWAENIRPGSECWPAARRGHGVDFVTFPEGSGVVIRESAIVMQRTTNNRQSRRLVAAVVPSSVVDKYGGFISENHTVVIRRTNAAADLGLVCALLGTEAADQEFRRLSTGAHVSVTTLRTLPLPDPHQFSTILRRTGDSERAAAEAYRATESPARRRLRTVASR